MESDGGSGTSMSLSGVGAGAVDAPAVPKKDIVVV